MELIISFDTGQIVEIPSVGTKYRIQTPNGGEVFFVKSVNVTATRKHAIRVWPWRNRCRYKGTATLTDENGMWT